MVGGTEMQPQKDFVLNVKTDLMGAWNLNLLHGSPAPLRHKGRGGGDAVVLSAASKAVCPVAFRLQVHVSL